MIKTKFHPFDRLLQISTNTEVTYEKRAEENGYIICYYRKIDAIHKKIRIRVHVDDVFIIRKHE
jgi:hypothetical protein